MNVIGKRYALAVFQEADKKTRSVIEKDFDFLEKTFLSSKHLMSIMANPIVKPFQKADILKAVFKDKLSEMTMRFLTVMIHKDRADIILPMVKEFRGLVDEEASVVDAYLTTAVEISEKDKAVLAKKLQKIFNKTPRLNCQEDKSIIGGFYVRVGDSVIDESFRHKLKELKKQLQYEK